MVHKQMDESVKGKNKTNERVSQVQERLGKLEAIINQHMHQQVCALVVLCVPWLCCVCPGYALICKCKPSRCVAFSCAARFKS